MKLLVSPGLVLFFLAPAIGELLSGSSPPAEFFNPVALLLMAVLYGGGAILCRELTRRWDKGWPTLFVLGAAYGIVEEGLMVKSFFDPGWVDLGPLGEYGRWAGVNWVWALHLTIFHAVFSIAIPVLLVGLLFPDRRSDPWVGRRGSRVLAVLFAADVVVGYLFLTPYRPPLIPYVLAGLAVVGLIWLARQLANPLFRASQAPVARAPCFLLVGFLATLGLFLVAWVAPKSGVLPVPALLLMAGLVGLTARTVLRMSGNGRGWTERHQLALAAGALGFLVALTPIQELDRARADNPTGMTLAGLAAALLLVYLAWRMRFSSPAESGQSASSRG